MPYVWTRDSAEEMTMAQAFLERAIAIDPDYPRANCLAVTFGQARSRQRPR